MKYFIAYKDQDGKDFNGFPWITPEYGLNDLELAQSIANDLTNRGFVNTIVFGCKRIPEEVDWQFVDENQIVEYI